MYISSIDFPRTSLKTIVFGKVNMSDETHASVGETTKIRASERAKQIIIILCILK